MNSAVRMTFRELIQRVLEQAGKPLSAKEIWAKAKDLNLAERTNTKGQTPEISISSLLYRNQGSLFTQVEKQPPRFRLITEKGRGVSTIEAERSVKIEIPLEENLHAPLVVFCRQHLNAYCKTIKENRSKGKKDGTKGIKEWIHPDIVGCSFKFFELGDLVNEFSKEISAQRVCLYSFEIKRVITRSTLKDSFYQSVANSSWSHVGYLVACAIDDSDTSLLRELKRLSELTGIGVIILDAKEPENPRILFDPIERDDLDWPTIDILCENTDFSSFLRQVTNDLKIGSVTEERYDTITRKS